MLLYKYIYLYAHDVNFKNLIGDKIRFLRDHICFRRRCCSLIIRLMLLLELLATTALHLGFSVNRILSSLFHIRPLIKKAWG